MNEDQLAELIERHAYDNYYRRYQGDREKLTIFLNYRTFKDLRYKLTCSLSFYSAAPPDPNTFLYGGVRVSWSPLVAEPDGYVFGRVDLF